jgi:hypothetical protein
MGKKKVHFDKDTLNELLPYSTVYYQLPRKKKKAMKKKITKDIEKAIIAYIDNHLSEHGELNLTTEI